jgi:hypothetical protein
MAIEHENTYSLVFDPSVLVPWVKQSITVTNDPNIKGDPTWLTFWITESTYGRFLALIVLLSP